MLQISVDETIERPIQEVWAYVQDFCNELEWQSAAREREILGDGEIGEGTRFRAVDGFLGRKLEWVWEVTEYEPEDSLVLEALEGPMESRYGFEFTSVEAGTKVTFEAEAENGLGRLFGKLLDSVVVRIFERESRADIGKLRAILEA